VTLTSPADGALTNDWTPAVGGAAGAAAEDDGTVTVKVYAGTQLGDFLVRTVQTTRSGGTWSANVGPPLGDGRYTVQARQADAAGNVGLSQPRVFDVDGTPPTASYAVSPSPALAGHEVSFEGAFSGDEHGITRYEWDFDGDGDFDRDSGTTTRVTHTYRNVGEVRPLLRVTDGAGNRSSFSRALTVAPPPPPGLVGVTINDGERFTNTPDVFIHPVWPAGATDVILSNDGGFGNAATAPLGSNLPWRLESSGPERLPKTIYARFDPNGSTFQDDIILDETAPSVTAAEIAGSELVAAKAGNRRTYHLRIKARDRTAGVSRMQITTERSHPGHGRRYRSRVDFTAETSKIYVRVRDRAGNWSRWKRCSR
jgi:hypothetical protein